MHRVQEDAHTRDVNRERRWALALASVATLVAALDGVFKFLAHHALPQEAPPALIAFIFYKNPGIAFNIPVPLSLVILLSAAAIVGFGVLVVKNIASRPLYASFGVLVILGALGNLIDRLVNGFTTDYILLFGRSVVNLSDILIVTGIFLLLLYTRK